MRKRGRARYYNVYEHPNGSRFRDRVGHLTRAASARQANLVELFKGARPLYRLRVRFFTEPK
jgi:hypothetical protein